jgi:3-hydroxyacyl-CoA dehydrogenase
MLEIGTIAVLGTGRDAVQVALLCSLAGLDVRLADEDPDALDAAFRALRHDVEEALADGRLGREERQRIFDGILFTPVPDEAVLGADLVYAAGVTDAAAARPLLLRLARSCRATTLLATALDPSAIAGDVPQPGRVVSLTLDDDGRSLPRLGLRSGPETTAHARARGEQLAERVDRAAGEHR